MHQLLADLKEAPLPARWAILSAAALGFIGGWVGFIVGLSAHPATAGFAVVELGVPAGVAGAILGFTAGMAATALRLITRRLHR